MLENYEKLENGLIKQQSIVKKIMDYNVDYVNQRYNTYGEKGLQMAYLRLGYLLGVLKSKPNSILDIGYGNGDFLKVSGSIINECYGNDISEYPLPENVKFVSDIFDKHYDVISMFDVLEHFEDINFVKRLKCDYIFISVPWCHYLSDEWFDNWKHRRVDEHLWHFNEKSINQFFNEMGFELIEKSDIEDIIRKPIDNLPNILTCVYRNIK